MIDSTRLIETASRITSANSPELIKYFLLELRSICFTDELTADYLINLESKLKSLLRQQTSLPF